MRARGWADRIQGGPSDPGSERPGTGRDPGSRRPDPGSGRPDSRRRYPVPEPRGSALRVILVSRDNMLVLALRSLVEAPGGVRMLDWHSDELDGAIRNADVVVVDMPPDLHERTFAVIDGRFVGRTVVLLQKGEHAEVLPPGPPRAVLSRPLQIAELWAAITGIQPEMALEEEILDAPATGTEAEQQKPEASSDNRAEPGPDTGGDEQAAAQGPGLPVAESGLLIGLSGRELEPVIGPGQVAPGMDEETLDRLRRWGSRDHQAAQEAFRQAREARAAEQAAAREEARRIKAARAEARQRWATSTAERRAQAQRAWAARLEARRVAREEADQAKAARARERQAAVRKRPGSGRWPGGSGCGRGAAGAGRGGAGGGGCGGRGVAGRRGAGHAGR